MEKLTDKERLDRQFGRHKPERAADGLPKASRAYEDARRPMRAPNFGANYGPSASYTPASDDCGGYQVPDRSDAYPDPSGE